jgi:hypothetical protein
MVTGILYREQHALAILRLPDGNSRIVHPGDILNPPATNALELRIAKIDKTSVWLQVINAPTGLPKAMHSKIIHIPAIIGYQSQYNNATNVPPNTTHPASP